MKEYWLGTGIGYATAMIAIYCIFGWQICVVTGIMGTGIFFFLGKYLEEREWEELEKMDKEGE